MFQLGFVQLRDTCVLSKKTFGW